MPIEIRTLETKDRAAWLPLWEGYLAFYQSKLPAETTAMTWQRFHDPAVPIYALGAFADDRLIGIVHYLLHHSCWTPSPYCYLQDLFVAAESRSTGAGRALIEGVYAAAASHGANRVYWLTQETNTAAMALYDQVATKTGFVQYRKMLG
jgi:GNAT superfamily N-acetyltransferase